MVPRPLQQHSPLPGSAGLRPRGLSPSPPEANGAVGSGFVEDPLLVLGTGFPFHKQVVLRATEWKTHPIGVNGNFAISLKMSKNIITNLILSMMVTGKHMFLNRY